MAGPVPPVPAPEPPPAASAHASALLEALFAGAPVGLAYCDRELRFVRINAELAAMNGLSVEDHLGHRPSQLLPSLGPRLEELFRRAIDTGRPVRDVDLVGETPSAPGETRHWVASYLPVRAGGEEPIGVAGIVVEVTGERRARRRAAEARQRSASVDAELRALYAALPVGVAFLGPDLRYRRVNETLARMNARSVEEHAGASLDDVLGEGAAAVREALERVVATREPVQLEVAVAVEAGDEDQGAPRRTFEATYFPVLDGAEELIGIGGVVRDVTQRHQIEVEQSRLLREALLARAQAEAAQVRADDAREEAERAREDAERARGRVALLARAGREMAASMDWEETLRAVVRSAVPEIADWSVLTVVERAGRLRVVAVAHDDPARERVAWELAERYPPRADEPAGVPRVIRTGEPAVITDITPDMIRAAAADEDHLRLLESLHIRHAVIAPLKTPAGVVGALSFVLGDSGRRLTAADLDLVTSLAARAGLHIQNARLYAERSHIARTLQAGLRPRGLPDIPGAELAARFRAAGDQNEVGGDFYDVFVSGDGVWTAIIGDVSGKGPEAAAVTALARHTLRTASMLHDDPAANLALLDRALHADSSAPAFCTAFYARLCPSDTGMDVRFSNAGHPAPLLLRPDGTVTPVESGRGPLVGALNDAIFSEGTLELRPGDVLVMYTDGVTEVRASDPGLGEHELRATLAAHGGASAEDIVAAVERRAVELQDEAPRDDIAVVAVRVLADG